MSIYLVFSKKIFMLLTLNFSQLKKKIFIGFLTLKKYQGTGIFKIIFFKIIKKFKLKYPKEKKLYLGVDKKNYRALSLYKKLGFKHIGKKKFIMTLNV